MKPVLEALDVYRREACSHTFHEVLEYHLEHGFVHSTPEFFVMARPVCSGWPDQVIVDPMRYKQTELTGRNDSWHIALMAGDMRDAWKLFPYSLPLISLERSNQLKFYDYERFRRTLLRG